MPVNIKDLRAQDFARGYKWSVQFPSFYQKFFPASSFTDQYLNFENGNIDYGPESFAFPEKLRRGKELSFEVYEFDGYPILTWIHNWYLKIKDDSEFTVDLLGNPEVARILIIKRFNLSNVEVFLEKLLVIPTGDVSIPNVSEKSASLSVSLTFTVVGGESAQNGAFNL